LWLASIQFHSFLAAPSFGFPGIHFCDDPRVSAPQYFTHRRISETKMKNDLLVSLFKDLQPNSDQAWIALPVHLAWQLLGVIWFTITYLACLQGGLLLFIQCFKANVF
jgi:hypothetical protein